MGWQEERVQPMLRKDWIKAIRYIEWRMRFPEGSFFTLTAGGFDHSPILFVETTNKDILPQPSRFQNMWFTDEECETLLEEDGGTRIR